MVSFSHRSVASHPVTDICNRCSHLLCTREYCVQYKQFNVTRPDWHICLCTVHCSKRLACIIYFLSFTLLRVTSRPAVFSPHKLVMNEQVKILYSFLCFIQIYALFTWYKQKENHLKQSSKKPLQLNCSTLSLALETFAPVLIVRLLQQTILKIKSYSDHSRKHMLG